MMRGGFAGRGSGVCAVLLSLIVLGACGTAIDTGPDELVSWRIDVRSFSDTGFGARILLNGEEVYSEAGTTLSSHSIDVVRPYVSGDNLVEVEIVGSSLRSAQYVASCTAKVSPTSQVIHADGVPTMLAVGERLFLQISL